MDPIFHHKDFRTYLNHWIINQPQKGHGTKIKLAKHVKISTTLVSLVLTGQKTFTMDQAIMVCNFIGLSEIETDFFMLLIEWDRASTPLLRDRIQKKMNLVIESSKVLAKRLKVSRHLTETQKSIFYSSWLFSGIRNLVALPDISSVHDLSNRLNLPLSVVREHVDFLLANKLLKLDSMGKLEVGPAHTHLGSDSPFINKHHQNWRLRAISKMDVRSNSDLFYTCPMSLSIEDAEKIRQMLPKFVEDVLKIVRPSPSESTHCLNFDWFSY